MDRDIDNSVFTKLGELSSDVKHILNLIVTNGNQIEAVREQTVKDNKNLSDRLAAVEKFNIKVLAIASFVTPLLLLAVNVGIKYFMG